MLWALPLQVPFNLFCLPLLVKIRPSKCLSFDCVNFEILVLGAATQCTHESFMFLLLIIPSSKGCSPEKLLTECEGLSRPEEIEEFFFFRLVSSSQFSIIQQLFFRPRSVRTFHSVHVYLPIGHSDGDDVKDKHHVVEPFQKGNKSLIYYDGFANCVKNFLFSRLNYLLAVFIFINTQKF